MNKEDFTKEFYEEKIFNELKDVYFSGIQDIKMRYRELDVDYNKIYRRIINYRIKKYGTSCISKTYLIKSKEENRRISNNRKTSRYKRRLR